MKSWTWAIVAGLVLIAVAAFLVGRSAPRRPAIASPETGGPAPKAPVQATAPPKAGPRVSEDPEAAATPFMPPPPIPPRSAPNQPTSVAGGTYTSRELEVSVEAPKGGGWVMTDNEPFFRDPLHLRSKRLEIRREPSASDPRLAMIELHVLDIPANSTEAQELAKLERPGNSAKFGTFKVVEEGPIDIAGRSFQRRVTYWDARKTPLAKQDPRAAETKILSVRTARDGKLYALIAYSPADQFDSLRPDFDQAIQSLRLR